MLETRTMKLALLYSLVLALAFVGGFGAILFKFAFDNLGQFQASAGFLTTWFTNPLILFAMALGLGARMIYYAMLQFFNVSQITLFSSLGIVATLLLARVILKEQMTQLEIVGSVLIVAGVALIGR